VKARRRFASRIGVAIVAVGTMMSAAAGQDVVEEPWSLDGLTGTLTRPTAAAPGPAVLIVAGSGPTDRDGNGPLIATNTYRLLAHGLAQAGIASLRYDKRGIAASADPKLREADMRFDHFVDDAVAAAKNLSQQSGVTSVTIVGHSEGGLIGIMAATRAGARGLVLLATPGQPLRTVLREQLKAAPLADLRKDALRILDALKPDHVVTDVPAELGTLFRPSAQPYLGSMLDIDPAAELRRLDMPVLVMHAARDIQVARADRDALAAARPDAQVVTLTEANHTFKQAPADRAGNVAVYAQPKKPLDPGVLPPIIAFVWSQDR
jgi:uncharacterized protein